MLILGSYGFQYTEMRQKLGELLPDRSGNMLIIPLACMFEEETGGREKNCAAMLGFQKENIHVFDAAQPDAVRGIQFQYIVVLGGNTFKLLHGVRQYGLDALIRKQVAAGAVYIGFSAGAYLACRNIEYVQCFDDNNDVTDGDFTALGLTDKYVLCHFDMRGNAEIALCRNYLGTEPELVTIRNDELVVIEQHACG